MAMEFVLVNSSQIEEIGYDEETSMAEVHFTSGAEYQYYDVPRVVVDAIANAASPGRQFADTLKSGYAYKRIS